MSEEIREFFFEEEPNVIISFDEKNVITSIIGVRNDGGKVDNTDPRNPQSKKPISLIVRDIPTVNQLRHRYGFKGIPNTAQKVPRFIAVVEAYVDMATTEGKWGDPLVGDEVWEKKGLGNYNNIIKFFYVADQVGFFSLADKQRKEYQREEEDKKDTKQSIEIEQFEKIPEVSKWLGRKFDPTNENADLHGWVKTSQKFEGDKPTDAKTLWQALILLDMTTDEFLAGTKERGKELTDTEKIEALTDRLEENTFQPVGADAQLYPRKVSLIWWANVPAPVPTLANLENPETGKMEQIKFAKQRTSTFDPANKGVQKNLTKMMRHFAESNGLTGTWTSLWSQKTPKAKHGEIDLDIHYLKDFEDCLRNAIKFNPSTGKEWKANEEFILYELEHTMKTNEKKDRKGNPVSITLADGKIVKPNQTYFNIKKLITTQKDWQAGWMYYRVAMDLGWRAEEGFTAGANLSDDPKMTGITETKTPDGDIFLVLRIMTRKTAHVNRSHHGGSIITPETMELIKAKNDLVIKYSDTEKYTDEEAKKHGVMRSYISTEVDPATLKKDETGKYVGLPVNFGKRVENKIHALVGEDDYFTGIETMELPAKDGFSKAERKLYKANQWQIPKVKRRESNRDKLHAIMRHCYAEIFADKKSMYDKYFKFHSLHALRHLFAQYWLTASALQNNGVRDYAMVMKLGHWDGVDVLMNFYGQTSNTQMVKRAMQLRTDYESLADEQRREREAKKKDEELNTELNNVDSSRDMEEEEPETNEETTDEL